MPVFQPLEREAFRIERYPFAFWDNTDICLTQQQLGSWCGNLTRGCTQLGFKALRILIDCLDNRLYVCVDKQCIPGFYDHLFWMESCEPQLFGRIYRCGRFWRRCKNGRGRNFCWYCWNSTVFFW